MKGISRRFPAAPHTTPARFRQQKRTAWPTRSGGRAAAAPPHPGVHRKVRTVSIEALGPTVPRPPESKPASIGAAAEHTSKESGFAVAGPK